MVYTPLYTSEVKIEGLLQFSLTNATQPSSSQVLTWIREVESEIVEKALGSHTATDQYMDIPSGSEMKGAYDWVYDVKHGRLRISLPEGVLIPLAGCKMPILSVTKLYKNDESPEDTPTWEELTEWDGTKGGTSFMLMKSGIKDLGYALWFYNNPPTSGPKRLKITYTYGYNVDSDILSQYCTLRVSERVLVARMNAARPVGVSAYTGPDMTTYVNTMIASQLGWVRDEADRIAKEHFPRKEAMAVELV